MKKIVHVVGARPNFMKAAPVWKAVEALQLYEQILVHTGQHYDKAMSDIFFKELNLPKPEHNLNIGSQTHAHQTAAIMIGLEDLLLNADPSLVIVYGDVNSTVAAALVCSKINIPFAHVEAGLRSFDRRMPEEINRLVTDQLADLLFTPSQDADQNLLKEGINDRKIHFVGNVMIDTLKKLQAKANPPEKYSELNNYILVTLHRPSNVDDVANLKSIFGYLTEVSKTFPVIFPIHPRTKNVIKETDLDLSNTDNLHLSDPVGYLEFLGLMQNAKAVVTDSGGIQEETTWLGIPCITVRENTERPVTVTMGTNQLIGLDYHKIPQVVQNIELDKKYEVPSLWDGYSAERIAGIIKDYLKE